MKQILFILFLLLIQLQLLGQFQGAFRFPNFDTISWNDGVRVNMDTSWECGYSTLPDFENELIIAQDLDDSIQGPDQHTISISLSHDYSNYNTNCLWDAAFVLDYKLIGASDSTGILCEVSWDSLEWYNIADSSHLAGFFQAKPVDWYWETLDQYFHDSLTKTLFTGEKVFSATNTVHEIGISLGAEYTYDGVGALDQFHTRLTFLNYGTNAVPGLAITEYGVYGMYWCEYLGINETEGNLDVKLYPNPVTECSRLELPKSTGFPAKIMITDPTGRIIYQNNQINSYEFLMNHVPLREGVYMYFIQDQDQDQQHSKGKFIVKSK
ncbi:MAG TPA: T9SS type A sorting domain-containing protein [Salinivirga sp.]|uniref:T9SS type A sorting domain-containing protein n=1 Tax=Salinivirga sp. TaxID=1970192 RepID=UPI002B46F9A6|nr:T9SS type A sorting domain-containing protein [Salinivirga sp.]HKK59821.1 T9SS type A sorting domain-containing protein [Salinivirga sp.]